MTSVVPPAMRRSARQPVQATFYSPFKENERQSKAKYVLFFTIMILCDFVSCPLYAFHASSLHKHKLTLYVFKTLLFYSAIYDSDSSNEDSDSDSDSSLGGGRKKKPLKRGKGQAKKVSIVSSGSETSSPHT